MDEKELADLLKYTSPKQLYIVTWNNILKLLFCPFRVAVLKDVGTLKKGQLVWVDEVKITQELKTVYIIKGAAYYYHHFDIIVDNE
ncbi:hypothetical protein SAMN06265371_108217 [Lutibacter agarilyticus]|uniref:Uncharacterized protein n=1 Tax=Lutibacter agarilyticus TaxID=1109740 RepID=A0A238YDI5_9FLAO|nr:hypothetical protein [Lutibacter agarilyticus]SNR68674.1 hypothetical protein SAMN06265371_108217 [Lutibacter agarilyticus]